MNELNEKLEALRREHKNLDEKLNALASRHYLGPEEQIEMNRLKKMKLKIKEEIVMITDSMQKS
jgi:hypothetical protein